MSTKKFDYRVRVQVAADSPDGILLDCIKNERHQSYSHKEMLLWALRAYWMPIAYQLRREQGELTLSDAQMKRIAQDAIHQLKQQITYLQSTFGIDQTSAPEESAGAMANPSQELIRLALRAVPQQITQSISETAELSPVVTSPAPPSTKAEQSAEWYNTEDLFDS
jgi:hypothetical protein